MISDVDIPSVRLVSLNFPMDLTYMRKLRTINMYTTPAEIERIYSTSSTYKFINILASPACVSIPENENERRYLGIIKTTDLKQLDTIILYTIRCLEPWFNVYI